MNVLMLVGQVLGASMRANRILVWTGPPKRVAAALGVPLALGMTPTSLRDPGLREGLSAEGYRIEVTADGRNVAISRSDMTDGAAVVRAQGLLGE